MKNKYFLVQSLVLALVISIFLGTFDDAYAYVSRSPSKKPAQIQIYNAKTQTKPIILNDAQGKTLPKAITLQKCKGLCGLALARQTIQNQEVSIGDPFNAKLVEDLKSGNVVILPSGAILKGKVTKITNPKRFPRRDGYVEVVMSEIELPEGEKLDISDNQLEAKIYSPFRQSFKQRVIKSLPAKICYYSLLIPLSATDLAGPAASAIAVGATAGAVAGKSYVFPEEGKSRMDSAISSGIETTPIGSFNMVAGQGKYASLNKGDGLNFVFDVDTIKKIIKERDLDIKVYVR